MTQVDFYILAATTARQRQQFACRLAEKAFRLGHSVYLHTDNQQQAEQLSELLWSFRPDSFIPHVLPTQQAEHASIDNSPVHIGHGIINVPQHQLLINLGHSVPEHFSRFERLSEIVVQDPELTAITRQNYKFYRDRGYPLNTHDLKSQA